MPRAPSAGQLVELGVARPTVDDDDRARRLAELGDGIHRAAIVGAVGGGLDHHDPLEAEPRLDLPVVGDGRRRRQEGDGRRDRVAFLGA